MITPFQTRAAERRAKMTAEIDAAKKTLEDATTVGAGFWVSYIFLMFYISVSAGAVTHADLLLENPVKLPFLNLDLPLLGFFFLAPILFIVMHVFTLSKLVMLAEKAKRFLEALEKLPKAEAREKLRRSLPSNIFTQFMAGPTEISGGGFGVLLRVMGWITMALAPVLLLLFLQIQFLPYHSFWHTWEHRAALAIDLALLWWLWRRALNTATPTPLTPSETVVPSGRWESAKQKFLSLWNSEALPLAQAASIIAVIFSIFVATFPFEWGDRAEDAAIRPFLAQIIFSENKIITHWPYNTLQLEEFNIFEALKLEDHDKLGGREFTKRLRQRRLEFTNLAYAKLGKADLREAKLTGARLKFAELQGAWLNEAELQGAWLDYAQLQGSRLAFAQLQGASLTFAQFQGAWLNDAELQGASLTFAQFQGATLDSANLKGATLDSANLQGATLDSANLQGAMLDAANLRGAALIGTNMQGVVLNGPGIFIGRLDRANLEGADLSYALVWRTDFSGINMTNVRAEGLSSRPITKTKTGDLEPWTQASYNRLREEVTKVIPKGEARTTALKRIEKLDCKSSKEKNDCAENTPHQEVKSLTYEAHAQKLYEIFKALLCDGDTIHILRGPMTIRLLSATRENAPKLIDGVIEPKIKSDCPVSAELTADDKARLLVIKKTAEKVFLTKPAPAKAK